MKEMSIGKFKDIVEEGLQDHFGRNNRNHEVVGQLSVYPERVGKLITPDVLEFQCEDYSKELKRVANIYGLKTHLAISDEGHGEHMYVVPDKSYELPDVIVDLTVGQYVRGHNHGFVGTREELEEILVTQTGDGKPYELYEPSELIEPEEIELFMEPQKFFSRKWGKTSNIV